MEATLHFNNGLTKEATLKLALNDIVEVKDYGG